MDAAKLSGCAIRHKGSRWKVVMSVGTASGDFLLIFDKVKVSYTALPISARNLAN